MPQFCLPTSRGGTQRRDTESIPENLQKERTHGESEGRKKQDRFGCRNQVRDDGILFFVRFLGGNAPAFHGPGPGQLKKIGQCKEGEADGIPDEFIPETDILDHRVGPQNDQNHQGQKKAFMDPVPRDEIMLCQGGKGAHGEHTGRKDQGDMPEMVDSDQQQVRVKYEHKRKDGRSNIVGKPL